MNFDFFHPIREVVFKDTEFAPSQFGYSILRQEQKDFEQAGVCLIGLETEQGIMQADLVRKSLYKLHKGKSFPRIFDLGNVLLDRLNENDWEKLYSIINECRELGHQICFIGGEKSFLFHIQMAFANSQSFMNLGVIDKQFSLEKDDSLELTNKNYLYKICAQTPSFLFNVVQLGYQQYLVNPNSVQLMKQLNYEELRLGEIRDDVTQTEPYIRDLDILGLSLHVLKQAETGGQPECSPNGLYSEELAQMLRYAGMSDRLSCIGFFDYEAIFDTHGACSQLIAQSIWCFLEGVAMQLHEQPEIDHQAFIKYTVHNDEMDLDLQFLKSRRSGRWWIEMPADKALLRQRFFMPCSNEDYQIALEGDIPERWVKGFNKLSKTNLA